MDLNDYIASVQCRRHWLPKVGPTTYLLAVLVDEPGGEDLTLDNLGALLGVSQTVVQRSIVRGQQFGLLSYSSEGKLLVHPRGLRLIQFANKAR